MFTVLDVHLFSDGPIWVERINILEGYNFKFCSRELETRAVYVKRG